MFGVWEEVGRGEGGQGGEGGGGEMDLGRIEERVLGRGRWSEGGRCAGFVDSGRD